MDAKRWKKIDAIIDAALEVPASGREKFVALNCKNDETLKKEVLELLAAHDESGNFLDKSAMNLMAKEIAADAPTVFDNSFINKTFGHYRIESMLGAGGMGEVYLATDDKLRRKVALKILPAEFTSNDERVKRFQLEARAISALNHPNIVTIYDVGNIDGVNYIATEYVEGKTLRELIGNNLKLKDVLAIIIQSCEALSAAHTAKIIHRDIKPENIMIRPDGYVKILDFGLAKLSEMDLHTLKNFAKTAKGVIIGTPAYMSPEQIADEKVDHRTDLWSIGVVLYELLTGVNPYKKENRQMTFQAILSQEPPPASLLNTNISAELDQILIKALEKDADLSYQTASELRADLKRIKREVDSSPSLRSTENSLMQSRNAVKRQRSFLISAAAGLFLLLTTFGIWFLFTQNLRSDKNEAAVEWANSRNVQITDSPDVEGYPSLSPDGKNIIFASVVSGDSNIFLQRVGGKNPTNLTPNSKESDTMPSFSADGKLIAFRSERNPVGTYIMEETGENVRRVSEIGFHPSWSPDNSKIAVSDHASAVHTVHTIPNSAIFILDVKTGGQQKLETKGDAIMPNWSPNGHRIAFWFVAEGNLAGIATVPATGGEPIIIAENSSSDWNPVWSPDGKFIYFLSDRNGNMGCWRVSVDEKTGAQLAEPEFVSTPAKYSRHLTFSRDGKTLGYISYDSQSNLQSVAFDPKTLKISGETNWITRGDKETSNPDLSPNGEMFVVRQPTRTQEDLAIFDKNGKNLRNLMNDKFRERIPRWSPDGGKIAFHSDRSGKYQIWTINADGSNLEQITFTEEIGAQAAVFSPDGLRLAFSELVDDRQYSSILDLTKKWSEQTPQNLPPMPNNQAFSVRDWSADGKKLLFIYFEPDGDGNGIGVFNFDTNVFEKITETGTSPFWLNDNRHFIFTDRNAVFLCDSVNKQITELYKPLVYGIQHANISPDNKTIFFRYLQVDADVWLLDASQQNR